MGQVIQWIIFNIFVVVLLLLDLYILHRKAHEIKVKEALLLSLFWIVLALIFNIGVYIKMGSVKALEFLTGYLLEKSLSVDNIFVFVMIFTYFNIPPKYQHSVLFLGILGAIVFRLIFIIGGVSLLERFHWIVYIFGILLIIGAIKIIITPKEKGDFSKNAAIRIFKEIMPVTNKLREGKFFIKKMKKIIATRLFICLLVIETTDIVFAIDSVPAILAISRDPFIVYTSNIFAILGLRALYFAIAGIMHLFYYLKYGLCVILVFVGIKIFISNIYKIPIGISLGFLILVLTISIIASLLWGPKSQ